MARRWRTRPGEIPAVVRAGPGRAPSSARRPAAEVGNQLTFTVPELLLLVGGQLRESVGEGYPIARYVHHRAAV